MRNFLACLLACAILLPGAAFGLTSDVEIDMGAGEIRFESQASVSIASTLPLPDGTLLIAVSEGDDSRSKSKAFPEVARRMSLLRLSPEGHILWERTLGETDGSFGLHLLCEAADGSVLALTRHSVEQKQQYQQLLRFSLRDGSTVWSGDRLEAREDISERALPLKGGYLWITVHDPGATTTPRYYALRATDGTQRWQVDEEQTVGVLEEALTVPGGTLLLGKNWADGIKDYRACAALVDDAGNIVWQKDYEELGGSFFLRGAVSPDGELAAMALVDGEDGLRQYELITMNADNGELRRLAAFPGEDARLSEVAPSGGGWLVCGSSSTAIPPALRFIEVDAEGNTIDTWNTLFDAEHLFSPKLFAWKGELWVDVMMEPVEGRVSLLQRAK